MSTYRDLVTEFEAGVPFSAELKSAQHPLVAAISLLIGILSVIAIVLNSPSASSPSSKSFGNLLQLLFYCVVASVSIAFGITFLSSAVGVYA